MLVVYNGYSKWGREIAGYYAMKRHVPPGNIVRITCTPSEETSEQACREDIARPIEEGIRSSGNTIDFVLLTKGVPIRLKEDPGYSVDSFLAAALSLLPVAPSQVRIPNPYFGASKPFSRKEFGFYLVTRLDGYTAEDCRNLVDNALKARSEQGPFLLDEADNRNDPVYLPFQKGLARAADLLRSQGFHVIHDQTREFVAPIAPLAGYASWGSNDAAFSLTSYKRLRFRPGSVCETFVSTSGRTFNPTFGGQSLIADLIANGVTGIKGYVSEPYALALAKPDILFGRYTSGRNLAESFYAASEFLKWKDVVIGDPLCCPYGK